jgi:hypothetical protein
MQHKGLSGPAAAASAAAAGGSAPFMPALRELYLSKSKVRHDSFLQLSQLTGLISLRLRDVTLTTASWAPVADRRACKAFTAVLQQLQGLETVELQGFVLQDPAVALAPLSTMQRLQQLSLSTDACSTAALAHLPTSLTSLNLLGFEDDYNDGVSFLSLATSSLKQLPLLCAAHLTCLSLDPGVLAGWTRWVLYHLCCTVLYMTAPPIACCTALHCTALYCTVLCCTYGVWLCDCLCCFFYPAAPHGTRTPPAVCQLN